MRPPLSPRLQKLLLRRSNTGEDDEFNAVLLQITMAVMLIFMIAFFVFMQKVGGEINRIDAMKQQISEAEKEHLQRIVEAVAESYRIRYGLKEFLFIDPVSGKKSYVFDDVIRNGHLSRSSGPARRSFLTGSAAAAQDYADVTALEGEWMRQVTQKAGSLAQGNQPLLETLIHAAVRRVRREVVEVQTLAAAAVQEHFLQHPQAVNDPEIRALLVRIGREPASPDRGNRVNELSRRLQKYVYDELRRQCGVKLLEAEI